jgi:hypothetical protein
VARIRHETTPKATRYKLCETDEREPVARERVLNTEALFSMVSISATCHAERNPGTTTDGNTFRWHEFDRCIRRGASNRREREASGTLAMFRLDCVSAT